MSTARRRPTGSIRRPQVAGRPRTAGPTGDPEQPTEGGLAVDERTGGRGSVEEAAPRNTDAAPRNTDGPGAGPVDPGAADDPAETSGDLPAASVVRSGATDDREQEDQADQDDTVAGQGAEAGRTGLIGRLRRIPLPQAPATRRGTAALLAVTILLVAAAGFFAVSWARLTFSGATSNTALTDVGATATVSEQVNEAVTKVYSFDFARLDQAESDARAVITGPFTGQFDQIFGNVRQLAPKQQAVVTATIPKSAVSSIDGDHATVYLFVNQVIRRVDDAGKPQEGTAAARLRVDADYVDGRWKISGMTPA